MYPFSDGGRQALLLAWGFGRYAPEASVRMSRDSEKARRLRDQRREALAPAPSPRKPVAYDSNPALAGPSPQAKAPPGIHAGPESVAASRPRLKGYARHGIYVEKSIQGARSSAAHLSRAEK
jgi:hypothetical protein